MTRIFVVTMILLTAGMARGGDDAACSDHGSCKNGACRNSDCPCQDLPAVWEEDNSLTPTVDADLLNQMRALLRAMSYGGQTTGERSEAVPQLNVLPPPPDHVVNAEQAAEIARIKKRLKINVLKDTIFDESTASVSDRAEVKAPGRLTPSQRAARQRLRLATKDNVNWPPPSLPAYDLPRTPGVATAGDQPPRPMDIGAGTTGELQLVYPAVPVNFDPPANSVEYCTSTPLAATMDLHCQLSADERRAAILRKVSKQLVDAAEQLEDERAYDEADGLRQSADEVRHQARQLRGKESTTATPAGQAASEGWFSCEPQFAPRMNLKAARIPLR